MSHVPGFDPFDETQALEQAAPPKKKSKTKRRVAAVLLSFLAVVLLAGGAAGFYAYNLLHTFDTKKQSIPQAEVFPEESSRPTKAADDKSTNFLLLGSDTRAETTDGQDSATAAGRSDTIMFVHVPADRHDVTVTSIMRDNWVSIPGHGDAKINAAFSYGGIPLAVQTIESLFDTRIDHVATIDFQGFKDLVDAIGGVEVTIPKPFTKAGTHYEGTMTLNGEQALWFARERHSFIDSDYQRVKDQQILMSAIIKQTLSKSTLTSPSKVSDIVSNFSPYIGVDESLSGTALAELGFSLREVRAGEVHFFTLPTLGTGRSPDGKQSIVKPDTEAIAAMGKALKKDDMDSFMKQYKLG